MKILIVVLASTILVVPFFHSALAAEHEVTQEAKAFSTDEITIKVGDTVNFKNNDSFFHNIFSLSDAAGFDLGSYPKGEYRSVKFDDAGVVEVECAIHPDMILTIVVQ